MVTVRNRNLSWRRAEQCLVQTHAPQSSVLAERTVMSESPTSAGDPAAFPQLPPKAGRTKTGWVIAGIALAVAAAVVLAVAVTSAGRSADASGSKTVTIGVADAAQPYWKT